MSRAITDVLAERQRQQTVEGFTLRNDDEHDPGFLATAGACYLLNAACLLTPQDGSGYDPLADPGPAWPMDPQWWKPKDARQDLVRAAALVIAELERFDREAAAQTDGAEPDIREVIIRIKPCFVEQGMMVFDVDDDMEWWAGPGFGPTFEAALKAWGSEGPASDAERREVANLMPLNLDEMKVDDSDRLGKPITLREHLRNLLAAGQTFPCFVGGRE